MKVYCINCKFSNYIKMIPTGTIHICKNIEKYDPPHSLSFEELSCISRNVNNNCLDYKTKWYLCILKLRLGK